MFAVLLAGFSVLATVVTIVQAIRKRAGEYDLIVIFPNVLWVMLLFGFAQDWFGVYGD